MLALPHTNSWGFRYKDQDVITDANAIGSVVIPGASGAEGSWTEIVADANVTTDIYYVRLSVHNGFSSGASKQHLLDFGWDPAGGTSYVAWFSNLACGTSSAWNAAFGGHTYHFPCRIPAGSAIAVRVQGSNATAGTLRVAIQLFGKPSRPELWRPAAYTETLGYTAGTLGTSFTPGGDTWGSWASLGTTTKKHFWAQLGVQCDQATVSGVSWGQYQLGIGDVTNKHIILESQGYIDNAERMATWLAEPCQWEIASGAELWVRSSHSGTVDSGYNATAVLFGG